jgi:hypothetical protein
VLPEERLAEPLPRDTAEEPAEREAAVAPERLTLAAREDALERVADEAEELRSAEEERTEEERVVVPFREADEAAERVAADRATPLRAWEELPRMEGFPSRCPTEAAREGSKR